MRVLEVGAGSGYSTALLAHLVGPMGTVVSLDVDAALTARAAGLLERAGCGQVTVVAADWPCRLPCRGAL
jgi:protein-L-isoaspartate(D-aspartate) O-methyltransferase